MKKVDTSTLYQRMFAQFKYQRIYKLGDDQLHVLNHLAFEEMNKQLKRQPFPPLTEDLSVRSIKYHQKCLVKKGFLNKDENGYSLTEKAYKMFEDMFSDPGIEFS
jgi:hypothetical protein